MLVFLVVTLSLLVGVLSYGCWNLLKRNEELEEVINLFYARTNATVRYMRFLDERQMFESDDEVGETFKLLVETVDKLYGFVTEIRDGNTTQEEEQ
jgi:hypothetical protein